MARCQGKNRNGTQCARTVSDDQKHCWQHRPTFRRWLRRITFSGVFVAILTIIGFFADLSGLGFISPFRKPERMTGDFRIAVAGFAEQPANTGTSIGTELAAGVSQKLQSNIDEVALNFTVTIWGPERVGVIQGADEDERAQAAAQLAEDIGANLVVYGIVNHTDEPWHLLPEFYVATEEFSEANEITGPHNLGTGLLLIRRANIAERIETSQDLTARTQILTQIAVGLAYYAITEYEQAYQTFASVTEMDAWQSLEGQEVVYLLAGNAAMKIEDLDLSEQFYEASLDLDPDYSRGYLGLAGIHYLRALIPYQETGDPTQIEQQELELAIANFNQSAMAANQPPLANIKEKRHFGMGQVYLAQALAGDEQMLNQAVVEFNAVITAYDSEGNHTLRQIAGESHARLGLIYRLSGNNPKALEEYNLATNLLYDNPERLEIIHKSVDELQTQTNDNQ
jgi:tetratricopeptide (TPR) repeat protein